MCLGIPGKIVEVYDLDGARMGKVDFDGIVKEICLSFVPEAEVGDYTIVHVGFGITKVDEASAHERPSPDRWTISESTSALGLVLRPLEATQRIVAV